ncbi:MAG: class II fructose-bisphosphate aldolase [Phycisphaerales bacterium]|jgi:fructose-bisphosphate aldolase class II/tagatose 1,6-diphosphate aldolase GatY/KbaY|nr:class II fructose-bisphosphate aldolase [Phycisphaerales bacterium]
MRRHRDQKTALLATNFYNYETLLGVLHAARQQKSEIILQTSPSTISYLGSPAVAAAMARSVADQEGVTAYLHLDHATDMDMLRACVDAGYDSVMIDASEKPLKDNIAMTRQAVDYAHAAHVAVESELGYVPKLGQHDVTTDGFTRPDEAKLFAQETAVDTLAVAIGTAHGFYKQTPRLDFDRLAAIRAVVDIPLVLHGGSGLAPEMWQKAIDRGIAKINFATEIKNAFIRGIKKEFQTQESIDLRTIFPPAIAAVTTLVASKIMICNGTH